MRENTRRDVVTCSVPAGGTVGDDELDRNSIETKLECKQIIPYRIIVKTCNQYPISNGKIVNFVFHRQSLQFCLVKSLLK